jgi:hypothetical protein
MSNQKLTLSKPIQAHDEECIVLEFREPTGKDIAACGFPFVMEAKNGKMQQSFDTEVLSAYIVRLAQIPRPSVDAMSPADFIGAMGIVMGFFADSESLLT